MTAISKIVCVFSLAIGFAFGGAPESRKRELKFNGGGLAPLAQNKETVGIAVAVALAAMAGSWLCKQRRLSNDLSSVRKRDGIKTNEDGRVSQGIV